MSFLEIGNIAANMLAGSLPRDPAASSQQLSPLNEAVIELRRRGHSVGPADGVPGLFDVSGAGELTIAQVIDLAHSPQR